MQAEIEEDTGDVKGKIGPGGTRTTKHDPAVAKKMHAFNQACDAYREAYNDIIKSHNLVLKVSWPEASRPEEWKIIGHTQVLGKTDKLIDGHIPVVHYARDFGCYSTHHIRDFLGTNGEGRTWILRLIVMNHLHPIYDLDGKEFWNAFWQCVACMHSLLGLLTSTDIISLGHHWLWVNGIHHGDISYNNLMYNTSTKTNKPVGIVNNFDLATWVNHSTTNNNRTGTIPFTAINLLDGGLDGHTPRLY